MSKLATTLGRSGFRFFSSIPKPPVSVHIWLPDRGSVGHVSLETKKIYASLWPEGDAIKPEIKWNSFEGSFVPTLEKDIIANGNVINRVHHPKNPDSTIVIKGLDSDRIDDKFTRLKNGDTKWALIGDNRLFLKGGIHSCASLVMLLLKEGGLENILQLHGKTLPIMMAEDPRLAFDKLIQDLVVVSPTNVNRVLEYIQRLEAQNEVDLEKDQVSTYTPGNL